MNDKTKLLKLRDELLLLRTQVESAIKEVTENDKRQWLSSCKCEQNAFASAIYGVACKRLLKGLEKLEGTK